MVRYIYSGGRKSDCQEAKNDECKVCQGTKLYTSFILCDGCQFWFHYRCINLNSKKKFPKDQPFACLDCQHNDQEPELQLGQIDDNEHLLIEGPREDDGVASHTSESISVNHILEEILDRSTLTQTHDHMSQAETTDGSADEEGQASVVEILDWKTSKTARKFLVQFKKDDERQWLPERDLRGCIDTLNRFCDTRVPPIPKTKMKFPDGIGATGDKIHNTANWVRNLEDIVQAAKIYGDKQGLQPQILGEEFEDRDAIYITRIGSHCYTILFMSDSRLCIVADGKNSLKRDHRSRRLLMHKLRMARAVIIVEAYNQVEEDHCGSSAAGIAIEFQRLHKAGIIPEEVRVAKSTMERLRCRFHQEPSEKLRTRDEVRRQAQKWKLECPHCGKKFKTANRGAFNLHKCPK